MNRREAIRGLLATLVISPGGLLNLAHGQTRVLRVAALTGNSENSVARALTTFREELKALGYVEGRNLTLPITYGVFSRESTRQLAAEAIAQKPDILFAMHGGLPALASLTKTIPIVGVFSGDMVEAGVVKSMARPGGNVTGVQLLQHDLVGKRIEILKEIVPSIKRLAVFAMAAHPGVSLEREVSAASAKRLGISIAYFPLNKPEDLETGLLAAKAERVNGLVLFPDPITLSEAPRIMAFALQHNLPVVSGWDNYAYAGGLVSYGPNLRESWRRAASFIDRVAKGADPATMPVEFPTIFELVVNLKTAKALGIKIPQSVLVRADSVIE